MKPNKVNICGVDYTITYVDKPSDVDINKRESLWGQIDYWTHTIRIFDNGAVPESAVFHSVMHEVLHGIADALKLDLNKPERHDELDILALALVDVLERNGWLVGSEKNNPKLASPIHTTEDDFQHFLSYSNLSGESPDVIALLRKSYFAGAWK